MPKRSAVRGADLPVALLCGFALIVGCATRSSDTGDALTPMDRAAIRALDSTFVASWLRDDTAAVLHVFAPDAVLIPPGGTPVVGTAAIQAYWWPTDGSHTHITSFQRAIAEVEGTRHLAFIRGTASLGWTYRQGGKESAQTSRSSDLLIVAPDSAGHWHVTRQMWGTLP